MNPRAILLTRIKVEVDAAAKKLHQERCKRWRDNHPEASREASRRWRKKNPSAFKLSNRLWKYFNADKNRAITQAWRAKNPNYQREYRARKKAEREAVASP